MSAKALAICSELRDDLARRFTTVSGIAFDSDGLPYITVTNGTLAAGQQAALVKVSDIAPLGTNGIGQSAASYGVPAVIQVALETSTIANVPLLTGANMVALLNTLALRGQRVELYLSSNTDSPDLDDITSSKLKATWDADQKYKTMMGA